jgi:multiple sugar transport system substrate-binding protein
MFKQTARIVSLGILIIVLLASCAPPPATVAPTQPAPAASEAPKEAVPTPFDQAKIDWKQFAGTKITVGVVDFGDTQILKDQIADFEALTGITVDYQLYPEAEWNQKLIVDLQSTAAQFDVLLSDFMYLPQFAQAGFIENVDNYLKDPKLTDSAWFDLEDIFPALRDAAQVDGQYWGLPLSTETTLLYYRKDLFEAAGLKPPDNMDDLKAAAAALNKKGERSGIALRGLRGQGINIYVWTGFFRAFGADFFVDFPNDMTPTLNSPEGVAATDFYAKILQESGPEGAANWDWAEVLAAQQQDKTAMAIDASDFGFQIDDPSKSQTAGKWGYELVPTGTAGRFPSVFSFIFTINADSKNKEASWLFMEWVSSKSVVRERAMKSGTAIRESVWNDPALKENLQYIGNGQWMEKFAASLEIADANYRPRFAHWREMGDRLGIAVQSVIAGEKDAQTAMDDAQADITQLMKDNGYIK